MLLVLRVQQPVDAFDLALDRLDAFDGVLHLVDQASLDRLGELDLADPLRHLDAGAHGRPARLAVLPLVACVVAPLGVSASFSNELLGVAVRLAHALDLLLHLARSFRDALVGDLFVVEDHQFANRAVAGVQCVAELDDLLGHERRARDRLDDGQLAPLDAARDFHFAFAREQRHRAHLAQVHADGVVGLVQCSGREIELEFLGPFSRAVDRLVVPHGTSGRSR